ncbi:MAG: DUF4446 family protein [Lachnospiraceae bacterium]|nr:DUF4446 family protein [Lachnospiraceae bacterium]
MIDWLKTIYAFARTHVVYILAFMMLLLLIMLVLLIINQVRYRKILARMEFFMRDPEGDSLEEVLREVLKDNREMKIRLKNNTDEIVKMNENMLTAIRKTGIVKYNAFPGMAGKVSSSIALLTNENNGVVINCMHGPEGCYTYVKEIMNAKSISPLTKEDEEALKIALQIQL